MYFIHKQVLDHAEISGPNWLTFTIEILMIRCWGVVFQKCIFFWLHDDTNSCQSLSFPNKNGTVCKRSIDFYYWLTGPPSFAWGKMLWYDYVCCWTVM